MIEQAASESVADRLYPWRMGCGPASFAPAAALERRLVAVLCEHGAERSDEALKVQTVAKIAKKGESCLIRP